MMEQFILYVLTLLVHVNLAACLSNSFRIVGIPGSAPQLIPKSYASSFSRWFVVADYNGHDSAPTLTQDESTHSPDQQLFLMTADHLSVRPTLDVFVKGGVPTYVMVGLQAVLSEKKTIPLLAEQWTTFALAVEPNFRILLYQGAGDGTDERVLLVGSDRVRQVLQDLGTVLSSSKATALSDGFHIVSFPVTSDWTVLPVRDTLSCLATAEPDAREVLSLDQDLLDMTVTSLLQLSFQQKRKDSAG